MKIEDRVTKQHLEMVEFVRQAKDQEGPATFPQKRTGYEARVCKDMPADCCDYGVVSFETGKEVCRVWQEEDARKIAALLNAAAAARAEPVGWRSITEADKTIVDIMDFPEAGITLRNSAHIRARDEDGRTYEAAWTDHKGGYWWDFDSESPADPVEFKPLQAEPASTPLTPTT